MKREDIEYVKNLISEAFGNNYRAQSVTKKTMYPHFDYGVFMNNETGKVTVSVKLGPISDDDATKAESDGFGMKRKVDTGVWARKNGRVVTHSNGGKDVKKTIVATYIKFNDIECPSRDKIYDSVKNWLMTDKSFPNVINVLSKSKSTDYKFGRGDGTSVLEDNGESKKNFFIYIGSQLVNGVNDKVGIEDVNVRREESMKALKDRIYNAFINGNYRSVVNGLGYMLKTLNTEYGFQLSPKNVRSIISTAYDAGLTPSDPNWPTFVRARDAWEKLGFYVCDDVRLEQYGIQTRKPNVVYSLDSGVNEKPTDAEMKTGAALIGHDQTNPDAQKLYHNGAYTQVGDAARLAGTKLIGGIHGGAFDKTDVVPIPGTMTWEIWNSLPGLRNNIIGELNDEALRLETEKGNVEKVDNTSSDEETAKTNEEAKMASVFNVALSMIVDNNKKISFKLANTDNPVKDYVDNLLNLAYEIISKYYHVTKNKNAVAQAVVICMVEQTIGREYTNGFNIEGLKEYFGGNNQQNKAEFTDIVLAVQDRIFDEMIDYSRDVLSKMASEKQSQPQVQTAQALNEEDTLEEGVNGIHKKSDEELASIFGLDLTKNNDFVGKYNNLLDRMKNLHKDNEI